MANTYALEIATIEDDDGSILTDSFDPCLKVDRDGSPECQISQSFSVLTCCRRCSGLLMYPCSAFRRSLARNSDGRVIEPGLRPVDTFRVEPLGAASKCVDRVML